MKPSIRCSNGILKKADLIITRRDNVSISDVSVCSEGPTGLYIQHSVKADVYSVPEFMNSVRRMYIRKTIYILPLIVVVRAI